MICSKCGPGNHGDDACPIRAGDKDKQRLTPEELTSESDWIDFVVHYWNNMNPDSNYDINDKGIRQAALSLINNQWGERMTKEKFAKIHFRGIKDNNKLIATAAIWIPEDVSQPAYLGALTVDNAYRARGLSKKFQIEADSIARQAGCQSIETAVNGANPAALKTELSAGYRIIKCTDYKKLPEDAPDYDPGGSYDLIKDINPKEKIIGNYDSRKVRFSAYRETEKLIKDNWEGVGMEYNGDKDEKTDNNPENWVLIFEKAREKK